MSKLVPNVTATARVLRMAPLAGKWSHNHTSICLATKFLCFEIAKHEAKGRFFADKAMIQQAGGPWFIQNFKDALQARVHHMRALHMNVHIGNVEALDLFSYRTCSFALDFNHNTLPNPIALQIVQKAQLFAIADEALERMIAEIA